MMIYMILLLFIGVLGLCFGSFVNAFVWRIKNKRNWVSERSECTKCHHELQVSDLVPIFSWIVLRGKCRYCKKSISAQYPTVEFLGVVGFVVSYVFWPIQLISINQYVLFFGWLIILVGMLALAVYDYKWMLLPNKILFPLIYFGLFLVGFDTLINDGGINALQEALLGVIFSFGFFYVLFQLSAGKWIGGGDVKLGVLIGLLVGGPLASLAVLFLSSLLGTLYVIPGYVFGKTKKTSKIPFGPFLIIATFIIKIFGTSLIGWYKHKILLLP